MAESTQAEKNAALLVASLAAFLTPFMGSSINLTLPSIGAEYNSDAISLSWIATAYLLTASIFLIPFGRAADIIGRKKIFLWGISIFTLASFFCGLANSVNSLISYRVFQAIGSSMIFGTGIAILTSVFPARERGKAIGISISSTYLGLTIGPFAGGMLTGHLGWRSVFFSVVPLGLIVFYFVFKKLKGEWADAKGEKFDWTGSILYGLALILIMYGFSKLSEMKGFLFLLSGLIFLIFFILWELKTISPILEINLFKSNVIFRYSNLAALINYSSTFAIAFLLSFYLQKIRNMSAQHSGLILVASPIVMTLLSPSVGKLSDRIEPRFLSSVGMGISGLGLILLFFISADTRILYLVLILLLLGLGFALFSSPNTNAVMSSVERKFLGVASGSLGTMRLVGQMLSMGIAMMLFALFIGKKEINHSNLVQLLRAIKAAFAIFAVLCIIGVFASLARGKLRD
jgi:EmrB/QacA subfamily drug resistance transporter